MPQHILYSGREEKHLASFFSPKFRIAATEKIADWQSSLNTLEALLAPADREVQKALAAMVDKIRHQIDQAIVQLLPLDTEETTANTMETKNRIIEVFNSVDRDFAKIRGFRILHAATGHPIQLWPSAGKAGVVFFQR